MCGIPIEPNKSNSCASCLASTSDVTKGISTEATLHQCRGCQRWHLEAGKWQACELESRELMTLCLKNINGLNKSSKNNGKNVRLVDASWIWTEPHSMRLKIRLTVQKDISGTILQQSFVVVFVVRNQQCVECQAEFRQGSWKSLVQVRQRVSHKRTFLYLEQLILKHGAHRGTLSIETFRDGMDFYFPDKGKAARFITFLESVVPVKIKSSKKLIGSDDKSNVSNFKYTNLVEICPLCKEDLLFLPSRTARNLGNISRLVLIKNVTNCIHLIDPLSGQTAIMNADVFWRDPIRPIITAARSRFMRYMILGKDAVMVQMNASKKIVSRKNRVKLAMLTLAKEDDLGINDIQFEERSHIGYLMKAGDIAVGYDLRDVQFVDENAEEARSRNKFPDVIVLRKLYGGVAANQSDAAKQRIFKLEKLNAERIETSNSRKFKIDKENDDMDEEDFLREVEADREMRLNINLYKSELVLKKEVKDDVRLDPMGDDDHDNDDDDIEDDQEVRLDELLDGLVLDDGPDKEMTSNEVDENLLWGGVGQSEFVEGARAAKNGIKYIDRGASHGVPDKDIAVPVKEFGSQFMDKKFAFK